MVKVKLKDIKFHKWSKLGENKKDEKYDWLKLKQSIIQNGFNQEQYKIKISKDGYCLDGHHRITVLKELYGEDYEINVKVVKGNYKPVTLVTIFLVIIFSPLLSPIVIYRRILTFFNRIWPRPK